MGDWSTLASLARGLAGGDGGGLSRSALLAERLDLPEVINEMAVQAVLNNMDRCTKNFFMYLNPRSEEWLRLPWDLDGAFGQDNGLGGKPGEVVRNTWVHGYRCLCMCLCMLPKGWLVVCNEDGPTSPPPSPDLQHPDNFF